MAHLGGRLPPARGEAPLVLLSRPPLPPPRKTRTVRLACFRHAASVYPEPGSNSPSELSELHMFLRTLWLLQRSLNRSSRSPPLFDCQRAPRAFALAFPPSLLRGRTSYLARTPSVKTCFRLG